MTRHFPSSLLALALAAACGLAQAVTLRVADVGDVQSMDPHSLNETLQLSFTGNIYEAFKLYQEDIGHIPLHQQALAWAMKNEVSLVQLPDNRMFFKWVKLAAK